MNAKEIYLEIVKKVTKDIYGYDDQMVEIAKWIESEFELKKKESSNSENIIVKGELLFILESKQDWVNKVPRILPDKRSKAEQWIWVDKNGNTFEVGADFIKAQELGTYPCKVYRLQTVSMV